MKQKVLILLLWGLKISLFAQVNLNNGLVAYYDFNGNTNDVSGNNYHGTPFGATSSNDRFGSLNQAYSFDGNDYIFVAHNADLNFGVADISTSLWINTASTAQQMILQKGGDFGPDEAQYWIRDNDNTPHLLRYLTSDGNPPFPNVSSSSLALHDGNWHHIATIRKGSVIEMYFDGCLVATDNTNGRNIDNNVQLIIGAQNAWGSMGIHNFFIGSIDEIRFYDRMLTAEEIMVLAETATGSINAGRSLEVCTSTIQLNADPVTAGSGSWRVIQGPAILNDPTNPKSTVQNISLGINAFEWTIVNGCESLSDTVYFERVQAPTTPEAGLDITLCDLSEVTLQANLPSEGSGYWSLVQGSAVFADSTDTGSLVTGLSPGNNILAWNIANACDTLQDQIAITVNDNKVDILKSNQFLCPGESVFLDATTTGATYFWSNGSISPVIEVNDIGTYTVTVSSPDCIARDSVVVTFNPDQAQCRQQLIFHNAINPASALAENRGFYLHNPNDVDQFEIFIFNRWGEVIFQSKDKNFVWSGVYKSQSSPSDLFAYKVIYSLIDDQSQSLTLFGDLYLMK